jgi:hypothetical protein
VRIKLRENRTEVVKKSGRNAAVETSPVVPLSLQNALG